MWLEFSEAVRLTSSMRTRGKIRSPTSCGVSSQKVKVDSAIAFNVRPLGMAKCGIITMENF